MSIERAALALEQTGLSVSRETIDRLAAYADLLATWNRKINLISTRSAEALWTRHVLDSLQLWPLIPSGRSRFLDLGSGAGLPGMMIAILATELEPSARVVLIEADHRKAAFLRTVSRTVGVHVDVITQRIEHVAPVASDLITARALAPLSTLIEYAQTHRLADGTALFPKGETVHKEIVEAAARWSFEHRLHPSLTDPRSAIVEIGAIDGPR